MAEVTGANSFPSTTVPATGTTQALDDYVIHLNNRGMSESHTSQLSDYLGRYCDWVGNTGNTLDRKSPEKYLSKSVHLKANFRAKYAT